MRIPRPAPGRAKIWVVATLGLVVMTVGAVWWGLAATVGKPVWADVDWEVKDERTVVVRYSITKPTDMTVRCLVEAQAVDYSLVGSRDVEIGPQREKERIYETTVSTTSKALRGRLRNCREIPTT
ncbi:protein of unknown function [Austwickia chelonae]|uniref:DUF4307 domain-containing protein n=1 Tax=Austwickia chelonae NBRC 105200 TaxID=1184607 RepID=K6VRS6_9MICO|nr:DUF4307 domain-containing protein [Austwickia chelonae]GAB78025.1 hypothetical protein AUCHE_08_02690 [Austwickia chelonae NBRC 105200]SEV94585.1 protein of unknown function [Austwickia chelonae]